MSFSQSRVFLEECFSTNTLIVCSVLELEYELEVNSWIFGIDGFA